jgi:hypothetical protein
MDVGLVVAQPERTRTERMHEGVSESPEEGIYTDSLLKRSSESDL